MVAATLNIDQSQKCPRCGRGGAVNGGLCMDCLIKGIEERVIMEFVRAYVGAGGVDIVKGKGKVTFEIDMEDLLDQRERLRDWADLEMPLRLIIEPMPKPQPELPGLGAGERQIPA